MKDEVVCPNCGTAYTSTTYVVVDGVKYPKCPNCGAIDFLVVKEDEGVADREYDVDEAKWEKENPELADTDVKVSY